MTDTEKLNKFIEKSGYKRSFIAEKLGITPYSLSNKVKNKTEFKASEISILCELLKIEKNEDREAIFFAQ